MSVNVNDKIKKLAPAQRKKVEAMGGNLSLVAEFPDREPVVLAGIAEDDPPQKPGRKHPHASA